jgi:hypothetical protein
MIATFTDSGPISGQRILSIMNVVIFFKAAIFRFKIVNVCIPNFSCENILNIT